MGLTSTETTVANLRAEIARRNLSGQGFGRLMGWSKNTTVRKLNGQSELTVAELGTAATLLGLTVESLVRPTPTEEVSA